MLEPAIAATPASEAIVLPEVCPACAEAVGPKDERCASCGERLRIPDEQEVQTVPPLLERARGVLLDPARTFEGHWAGWGWFQPWLLVVVCGVALGFLRLWQVDIATEAGRVIEAQMDAMPPAQRRAIDRDPDASEGMETMKRMGVFMAKVSEVAGPPLAGLLGLVTTSALVFMTCLVLRAKGARPDLAQAVSIAAHVELVQLVGIGARALGTLTGNRLALTSPAALADPLGHPVAFAALSRLDPVLLLWWVVLGVALTRACRAPGRLVAPLCVAGWSLSSVLGLAMAGAQVAASSMGGA